MREEIKLDEKWNIQQDTYSWVLVFREIRKRKEGKKKGESYLFENSWWHKSLQDCLERYVKEAPKVCTSIEELLLKTEDMHEAIKRVGKVYVSNGKLIQFD